MNTTARKTFFGVFLITSTIFFIELAIMVAFDSIYHFNPWLESLLDALFVTFISTLLILFYNHVHLLSLPDQTSTPDNHAQIAHFSRSITIFSKFAFSIFLTESFIMLFLHTIDLHSSTKQNSLLDAAMLSLVCGPISYLWLTDTFSMPKYFEKILKKQIWIFLFILTPLTIITFFIVLSFYYSETTPCNDPHMTRSIRTHEQESHTIQPAGQMTFTDQNGKYGLLFSCLSLILGIISWSLSIAIVQRRDAQAALEQQNRELEGIVLARTKQLVHADRLASLGLFSAGMAHEINNPNSFISGNVSSLRAFWQTAHPILKKYRAEDGTRRVEMFLDEVEKSLDDIMDGSKRISTIVESLKKYSKSGAGVDKHLCRLSDPVHDAERLLTHRLKKGTRLTIQIPQNLMVLCDHQQISQVFVNLINNAIDAMEQSRMTQGRAVDILAQSMEHHIRIQVRDNGPGIPASYIDKIFDPFFTSKGNAKGTGLGLAIVHGIIQEHGGEITVRSPHDTAGTEFLITLPNSTTHQTVDKARGSTQDKGPQAV
ncbi:MAG: GHKL domain-containing protein [Magnetococcales bacterium]|nr:GHKL domain-containing protein [Magnetococcales bacterium]